MDEPKLYICFEAKHSKGGHHQQQHVYLICSLNLNDLRTPRSDSPTLTKEASFQSYPSMGCGFYQSKIVFAGGQVLVRETNSANEEEIVEQSSHDGLITFDMKTKQLSSHSFPSMLRGKVKPLVFQLHDQLYVMDTISGDRRGFFEYFYPKKQEWNLLHPPMIHQNHLDGLSCQQDRNHPCLVFGSACFLYVPVDSKHFLYFHHPNLTYKAWLPFHTLLDSIPFSGVATFYILPGFRDFFTISFTKGVIRAHLFDMYDSSVQSSKELFRLPSSSESVEDEQLSGYFADFGDGIFSLTAFDAVCVYVCTFQIFGLNTPVKFHLLSYYEYKFNALSFGVDIISVAGCFASDPNVLAIKHAEELLKDTFPKFATRSEEDPSHFEFCGVKCAVPKECPGNYMSGVLLTLPFNTPLGTVDALCMLSR